MTMLSKYAALSEPQVRKLESQVDSYMGQLAPPVRDRALSTRLLLTVADDMVRVRSFISLQNGITADESLRLGDVVGNLGYAIKHALNASMARTTDSSYSGDFSRQLTEKRYFAAADFLDQWAQYEAAVRGFSLYHAGLHDCRFDATANEVIFTRSEHKAAVFDALQDLLNASSKLHPLDRANTLDYLMAWLFGVQGIPMFREWLQYAEETSSSPFDILRTKRLLAMLPDDERHLPDGWQLSWSTIDELRRFSKALRARCMHQILLTGHRLPFGQFESQKGQIVDLCLVLDTGQLISDLAFLADISVDMAKRLMKALRLGYKTKTPDPLLQPVIPLSNIHVALAPIQVVGSNFERNILALQARIDTKTFDQCSAAFEKGMVTATLDALSKRFPKARANVTVVGEEIDLLIAESRSRTVFVGELKGTIGPADVREVISRRTKELPKKLAQLTRKVRCVQANLASALQALGCAVESGESEWSIYGVVVIQGYSGQPRGMSPAIVPFQVFITGIENCTNLRVLCQWLLSEMWLPIEGTHFVRGYFSGKFDQLELKLENIVLQPQAVMYFDHVLRGIRLANERWAN